MYKRLLNSPCILRLADGAVIPADESNRDFQQFILYRDGWSEKLEDGTEIQHPPHEPEPADAAPGPTQDEQDAAFARAYPKLKALAGMTPAQVAAWVDGNVVTDAQRTDAIKTLAIAVSVLIRKVY